MEFQCDRLVQIRKNLRINKAEAARRLKISAMAYGRYEKGEREPSFQTVSFIAETFGTTTDYLYGLTENTGVGKITISSTDDPEIFLMLESMRSDKEFARRILAYADKCWN